MRRLVVISAFALSLAVPLWAQHGGGHAGGHGGGFSGHGGFSGGHGSGFGDSHAGSGGGHIGGGHVFGGARSGPGVSRAFTHASSFSQRGFSRGPYLHDRFRGSRFRTYGFRNNCYGYGCWRGYGYPWWYVGYYDPWWWWHDRSSYDEDREREIRLANEMNAQSLEEQRMLRREEAEGDRDLYAQSAPAPREAESSPAQPATVLVFRDQHQREVQNYAILGQTLWSFAPQRTEKISLADLDLAATTKANDDRGLLFRLPSASQTQ
jgi:hypothetical protein